jgi:Cu(I)/Ag(I) efflux system membrane fusion protein
MALVKKTSLKEATTGELAALGKISLSPTQRVIANVTTVRAEEREIKRTFTAAGIVDFAEPRRALVTARFRGRIENLFVDFPGAEVRKGQALFELYSPDLVAAQQDFLLASRPESSAAAEPSLADASRERLRTHFGMTESQIATIAREGQPRSTMTFAAPQSGTVLSKQVTQGQYVDEGTILYEVADLSVVWIYFDVYEQEIRFIKRGQEVAFAAESYPGERFTGRVTFIDPVMNPDTRTVRVRTEVSNSSGKLKPQMFVRASVTIQIPSSLVVPRSAVLSTGSRTVLWIETESNVFEPRAVTTGAAGEGMIQILSGLKEGELVAATGGYLIDSESNLQMPPSQGSAPSTHQHGASQSGSVSEVSIHVKGQYHPDTVRVSLGSIVRLNFYRDEESACTKEVVFKDFNIRLELPAWQTTTVELSPTARGTYAFTCGMEMVHGTLIVE